MTRINNNKIAGIITDIKRLETHDGPGLRTTVFVKDCPLRCKWCANPETQKPYPELFFMARKCQECGECVKACSPGAISMDKKHKIAREKCTLCFQCIEACKYGAWEKVGIEITPEELVEKIVQDRPFYARSDGGVTFSGGEPLSLPEFTAEVFRLCHEEGINTCLDTCGYAKPESVEQVLEHTDLVLLDLKQMDTIKHKKWTGVSNELILSNAELMTSKRPVRISLPLIPGVNGSVENIRKTIEFTKSLGIKHIDIVPLHKLGANKYEYLSLKPPYSEFRRASDEKINKIMKMIESYGLKATKGRSM